MAAEREVPVPPLADDEAAELFIARAQAADPDFALTEQNAGAVAELCARLDGLPLAIELAAARTKLLPPAALLSRLGNRLELLTGGRRDAPRHQQTLRMTLDWSYDLLDPEAQRLFAQLGVFAGGWTLPSAEAVCSGDSSVLEGLAALVDESLVRQRQTSDGEPRFSVLEIVREYALERLAELGEADDTRRRHLEHFVAFAEEAEPKLADRDQISWFARLEDEHNNLRAALAFALETGDSVSALRLVVGIRRFWQIHGYLAEGRQALESALAAASEEPSELRANALNMAGILAGEQGEFDAARARFEAALADARASGSTRVISSALVNLGNLAFFGGELEVARDLYKESIEHFVSLGDTRGQALAKENVGLMALTAGDVPEAVTWLTEALELAREVGDDREIGAASRSLAAAMIELGEGAQATSSARREPCTRPRAWRATRYRRLPRYLRRPRGDGRRGRTSRNVVRGERRGPRVDRCETSARSPDPLRPLARANARASRHEHLLDVLRKWTGVDARRGLRTGDRPPVGAGFLS